MLFFAPLLLLLLLSCLLNFNGLYGQDSHEYFRQCSAYADCFQGQALHFNGIGDLEMAGGYPALAACLHLLGLDAATALRWVSAGAYAASLWIFDGILRLTAAGAARRSRLLFVALAVGLAPVFLRAGLCCMSDALGMAFLLASVYCGLLVLKNRRYGAAAPAFFFAAWAVLTRYALLALLWPFLAIVLWQMLKNQRIKHAVLALAAGVFGLAPLLYLKAGLLLSLGDHSLVSAWSVTHFFQRQFEGANGFERHALPNIIYLLFPLAHPGFCLLLSGLCFLWRKTDLYLISQKTLFVSALAYLFFLGGLPHQNLRYLLPAYLVVLIIAFPAWDRMVSYGFYFFQKTTFALLAALLVCQLAGSIWLLAPVLRRSRAEMEMVAKIRPRIKSGDTLYGFDYDVAMRSYLPDVRHVNLWENTLDSFQIGGFILFNPTALRPQWSGKNPMLNWDLANERYKIELVEPLPDDWGFYQVR